MSAKRILILDEIVLKPGAARGFRSQHRERYQSAAERRGMRLEGAWQTPPGIDIDELPTTLYYLWSVPDVRAWWAMRLSRRPDGSDERFDKLAWWQDIEAVTMSRRRTMLADQPGGD